MSDFDLAPELIYLNHAAVAPWPTRTVAAVARFARENGRLGARHYPRWLETEQRLRERLARLINAPGADDIALLKSTSEGLSLVARGLSWRAGDNIVSIAQEFPSNRIVWESLAGLGVELRLLDLAASSDPEGDLLALCDTHTRLLAVSSVQYASGLRLDLPRLGEDSRRHDRLFCVDAIQQLGALRFDVQANLADFVVADGHKWMLGAEGLALFYCRAELREQLALNQFGWHMVEQAGDFERREWTPAASARRFECGSPNMLGIHALEASLELLERQGGEAIERAILEHTDFLMEEIQRHGAVPISSREPARRSGILTFQVPGQDPQALYQRLMQAGVVCAFRGGGIRFSPHFYNTQEELVRALQLLRELP